MLLVVVWLGRLELRITAPWSVWIILSCRFANKFSPYFPMGCGDCGYFKHIKIIKLQELTSNQIKKKNRFKHKYSEAPELKCAFIYLIMLRMELLHSKILSFPIWLQYHTYLYVAPAISLGFLFTFVKIPLLSQKLGPQVSANLHLRWTWEWLLKGCLGLSLCRFSVLMLPHWWEVSLSVQGVVSPVVLLFRK